MCRLAQRRLSTPARQLRRRTAGVNGSQRLSDGRRVELTAAGAAFLENLARLARAAGLGLVALSQDVRVVLEDKHGRTLAENAATVLLLGQSPETLRPLADAYGLSEDEQADLLAIGAGRDPTGASADAAADRRGEGLLLVAGQRIWLKPTASPGEHRLATTAFREVMALHPTERNGPHP